MGLLDEAQSGENSVQDAVVAKKSPGKFRNLLFLLAFVAVLFGTLGGGVYLIKTKPEILGLSKSQQANGRESENLVKEVSKIIKLPDGEVPTIATVSDLSKTQDKEFFKNALEGDKVLVYQNAKKAYLYRPTQNKIIEVGVVNVNNEPQKGGQVAGEQQEIPVISPTPLPTAIPTPEPTLRPTTGATSAPITTPTITP